MSKNISYNKHFNYTIRIGHVYLYKILHYGGLFCLAASVLLTLSNCYSCTSVFVERIAVKPSPYVCEMPTQLMPHDAHVIANTAEIHCR